VLRQVARHARFDFIGLPLLGKLYVRRKDVPNLPAGAGVASRPWIKMAADLVGWLGPQIPAGTPSPWVVVDGGHDHLPHSSDRISPLVEASTPLLGDTPPQGLRQGRVLVGPVTADRLDVAPQTGPDTLEAR
jgi:hypothetical protein